MPPTLNDPVPKLDITIKQNETFPMSLTIIERDDDGTAMVIDTSDWDVVMQVRAEPSQGSPVLLEASTANGRIVTGITGTAPDQINIAIKIPASVTAALEWFGCAGYDILAIYPGGDQKYLSEGQALIQPAYSWVTP